MTRIKGLIYSVVFAAIMAVCSWISIPFIVPVTLQTFAVFAAAGLLGWKKGLCSVLIYLVLGLVGVPVFSGFRGGFSVLAGPTGGYIIGFLFTVFISGMIIKLKGTGTLTLCIAFVSGLLACYIFGTVWYCLVYAPNEAGFISALTACVIPFILPDAAKLFLAAVTVKKLKKTRLFVD